MRRVHARSHCIPQDPHGRNRRGNSCGFGYTEFINSDLCVFIIVPAENASQIRRTRVGRDSCSMYAFLAKDRSLAFGALDSRSQILSKRPRVARLVEILADFEENRQL
jgi:hypothetical protein